MMKSMPADLENLVNEYKRGFEKCLHCTQIVLSRIQPLVNEVDEHFQMYHDLLVYVDPLEEDNHAYWETIANEAWGYNIFECDPYNIWLSRHRMHSDYEDIKKQLQRLMALLNEGTLPSSTYIAGIQDKAELFIRFGRCVRIHG